MAGAAPARSAAAARVRAKPPALSGCVQLRPLIIRCWRAGYFDNVASARFCDVSHSAHTLFQQMVGPQVRPAALRAASVAQPLRRAQWYKTMYSAIEQENSRCVGAGRAACARARRRAAGVRRRWVSLYFIAFYVIGSDMLLRILLAVFIDVFALQRQGRAARGRRESDGHVCAQSSQRARHAGVRNAGWRVCIQSHLPAPPPHGISQSHAEGQEELQGAELFAGWLRPAHARVPGQPSSTRPRQHHVGRQRCGGMLFVRRAPVAPQA